MRIAFVGLNPVIRAMAERLAARRGEHTVVIWPQVPADIDWIARLGAERANDHRAASRGANLVFVAMEPRDTRAVLFGAGQAVAELAAPLAVIVNLCGPPVDYAQELARYTKLFLTASLIGDEAVARSGTLTIHLRGVYGAVELAVPALELITTRIVHLDG